MEKRKTSIVLANEVIDQLKVGREARGIKSNAKYVRALISEDLAKIK